MEYGKYFHNCLRLPITDDINQDDRIATAVEHCVKYGFDNVAFMINAEEFNVGHITIEEAEPWIDVFVKAKERFEASGISVSVNNWIEMGHLARGRKLKAGQNFTTMVDANGVENDFVVCPLDENWLNYYTEYVKLLVSRLKPDTFWVEDDFRLHNHPPMRGVGCFCEKHVALMNKKLGTNYTRKELVDKIFAEGGLNKEREVWIEEDGKTMYGALDRIVKAIKEASPTTDVGIMSSSPAVHCVEGRDWNKFLDILSDGGTKINRIHLPFYEETSGKDALFEFNRNSMAMRAFCPEDTVIMPETEHGSANLYKKSARYLRFTLEAAMPLVLNGMTYSLYDFVANGTRDSFGYGQVVKAQRPYQQAVLGLKLKFSAVDGVIVPIDGKAAYKKTYENEVGDLFPKEYSAGAFLAGQGIAYKYSKDKVFNGETVFLTGSSADYFTDEELAVLFKDNYVIVDGSCVLRLKTRGLLGLINATDAQRRVTETGYQSYQQCDDGTIIDGVKNLRASLRLLSGDFVEVDYAESVAVHTYAYNEYMQRLAPAIVDGDKFTVLPFVIENTRLLTLFCDLTRYYLTESVKKHKKHYVVAENTGVNPYLYKTENGHVLMLVNGNVDIFDKTIFYTDIEFTYLKAVRRDGTIEEVNYQRNGDKITIEESFEYLSNSVYILTEQK